tara:strand:+ start:302 stop:1432 length:1131 start_codon:yes stop_codon:yes gene_type:complete
MSNIASKIATIAESAILTIQNKSLTESLSATLSFNWINVVSLDSSGDPVIPVSGQYLVYVKTSNNTGFERVNRPIEARKTGGSLMVDGEELGAFYGATLQEIKVVPVDVVGVDSYEVHVRQAKTGRQPEVPVMSYDAAIAEGDIQGSSGFFAFGRNNLISSGVEEFVIDFASQYTFLLAAEPLYISSSNAADTAVTMIIRILDTNYEQHDIVQTINGQTKTLINLPDALRVIFAFNVGSVASLGDVYVYANSTVTGGIPDDTTKILAKSDIAKQQSNMANYTIPAGKKGLLRAIVITANKSNNNGAADVFLNTKSENGVKRRRAELGLQTSGSSSFSYNFEIPILLSEKTDVFLTVSSTVNDYDVAGGFQIQLDDM